MKRMELHCAVNVDVTKLSVLLETEAQLPPSGELGVVGFFYQEQ